jgi:broad specificity phosphatase PhoE
VVGVADGFAVAEVFVGDGLGEAAGGWMGSHDSAAPDVAAVAAAALPAAAASTPPEATVTSTLPAAKVTAVRRARAKPMSMPHPIVSPGCSDTPYCGALNAHIEPQTATGQPAWPWLVFMNMR